ncbi:MAG: hypothetical protein U9N58_04245 [Thermodesulfobacteriota bacterium]|nr:hypothetical protein [Thermodesulfobacteriota bacterium]
MPDRIGQALKKGPRAFRIATIFEIINPTTKKLHHLEKGKGGRWF